MYAKKILTMLCFSLTRNNPGCKKVYRASLRQLGFALGSYKLFMVALKDSGRGLDLCQVTVAEEEEEEEGELADKKQEVARRQCSEGGERGGVYSSDLKHGGKKRGGGEGGQHSGEARVNRRTCDMRSERFPRHLDFNMTHMLLDTLRPLLSPWTHTHFNVLFYDIKKGLNRKSTFRQAQHNV